MPFGFLFNISLPKFLVHFHVAYASAFASACTALNCAGNFRRGLQLYSHWPQISAFVPGVVWSRNGHRQALAVLISGHRTPNALGCFSFLSRQSSEGSLPFLIGKMHRILSIKNTLCCYLSLSSLPPELPLTPWNGDFGMNTERRTAFRKKVLIFFFLKQSFKLPCQMQRELNLPCKELRQWRAFDSTCLSSTFDSWVHCYLLSFNSCLQSENCPLWWPPIRSGFMGVGWNNNASAHLLRKCWKGRPEITSE